MICSDIPIAEFVKKGYNKIKHTDNQYIECEQEITIEILLTVTEENIKMEQCYIDIKQSGKFSLNKKVLLDV